MPTPDLSKKDILRATKKHLRNMNTVSRRADKWDFANWLHKHLSVKRGGKVQPWDLKGYEPYAQIVQRMHEHEEMWILKGTQIACSTLFIGWNLYLPMWRGLDCAYALPDKVMIKPFMKTRFTQEQIANNPELKRAYKLHETELYYDCGSNYVYFLGANVLSETLSRPLEQITLDEVTIIDRQSIDMIQERLDAASFGQINSFAREIYPGGPADSGFQSGTQFVMMFKCPSCGEWQNLEEIFYQSSLNKEEHPKCVASTGSTSTSSATAAERKWQVVCVKCQQPYSRAQCGHWVAKFPDREVISYRLPQVAFEGMDLQRMMRRWLRSATKKSKRTQLHSSMLAIPDAGDLQRITRETLVALKRPYQMQRSATWSIGGMDMGNTCWIEFDDFQDDVLRAIWFQEVDSDNVFEIVSDLIVRMNCMMLVIDALPLTTEARRLAYAFPENVRLNYYKGSELKEDEHEHLGNAYQVITQDREQALDAYCDYFAPQLPKKIFPARVIESDGREVDFEDSTYAAHHLRGSQKDEVDDAKLGKKVYRYKKGVPNHFFHAGNYAATAAALLAKDAAAFSGTIPVFGDFYR